MEHFISDEAEAQCKAGTHCYVNHHGPGRGPNEERLFQ